MIWLANPEWFAFFWGINSMAHIADLERNKFWHSSNAEHSPLFCVPHAIPLASGQALNYSFVNKFGHCTGVGTSVVDVNRLATPAVYAWLTTAAQLEAISSSANDTADGTGARTIVVEGLDANFVPCSATITMAGTSASTATTQTFLRVHRAYVATSGAYNTTTAGPHAGNITIRVASAGAIQIYLDATDVPVGQSEVARYTIPAGYCGYLMHFMFSVDSLKTATLWIMRRSSADTVAAPFSAKRVIDTYNGIAAPFERNWTVPVKLEEKTDIWVAAKGAATGTDITASFDIFLVKM